MNVCHCERCDELEPDIVDEDVEHFDGGASPLTDAMLTLVVVLGIVAWLLFG